MKKTAFLISVSLLIISCQQPQKKEEEKTQIGKYQMTVIQRADTGEVCLFVLDTETGTVTMRNDKSGSWAPQGNPDDSIDKSL
ncbi:hypothetical protein [Flavobacterium johnsoniae]|jgi:hypothetical protein|uniref:Hypothetical lipoprotein n=1 Tax=Flavobacterium johnsoniae (strain ATCC 17061 / DSM 2064 / JCM 8514 / BCRC 14874 / CCUG 350202 / NBRC 14942 / NCIMB 11054 / UW101) TaxID=376686 RepID=A5FL42_FLAJ1|nr:hypothetical protein [Flavobacterium johnsoniae]ABQ04067.1 hypothetical lipoprotein [Flavobacterium johnsoniae UW101]OXG02697.1 hypothetical protein B0A63_03310 [Flavobacterium johnsoniae UW101]WQG79062.1 hypothetical protein SR927_13630 [Flavobacterium johnsoniae UW101]SHK11436.1 hypothetical protein SAMN05444146_0448 [Flavobacterium johnsoniae]